MKKLFLTVLFLILFVLPARATDYYCSQSTGSGADCTSQTSPCDQLSDINTINLEPGDNVYLYLGDTWTNEALTIAANDDGDSNNEVTITTKSGFGTGANPILDGNSTLSTAIVVTNANNVTIENITAKNTTSDVVAVSNNSDDITFNNVTAENSTGGDGFKVDLTADSDGPVTFNNCTATESDFDANSNGWSNHSGTMAMVNCTASGNSKGVANIDTSVNTMVGCTIEDNDDMGVHWFVVGAAGGSMDITTSSIINNNVGAGTEEDLRVDDGQTLTISYSTIGGADNSLRMADNGTTVTARKCLFNTSADVTYMINIVSGNNTGTLTMNDCELDGGATATRLISHSSATVVALVRCYIHDGADNQYWASAATTVKNAYFTNCYFEDSVDRMINLPNNDWGIVHATGTIFNNAGTWAIYNGAATGIKVRNCTFYSSGDDDIFAAGTTSITLKNNIFKDAVDHCVQFSNCSAAGIVAAYEADEGNNLFHGHADLISNCESGGADDWDRTGSITSDPTLVDAANDNFQLIVGSPAIDAGLDLGDTYDNLLNRTANIKQLGQIQTADPDDYGSGWEVGAYNYTVGNRTGFLYGGGGLYSNGGMCSKLYCGD